MGDPVIRVLLRLRLTKMHHALADSGHDDRVSERAVRLVPAQILNDMAR